MMKDEEGVYEVYFDEVLNHLQPKIWNCNRKGYFAKGLFQLKKDLTHFRVGSLRKDFTHSF